MLSNIGGGGDGLVRYIHPTLSQNEANSTKMLAKGHKLQNSMAVPLSQ